MKYSRSLEARGYIFFPAARVAHYSLSLFLPLSPTLALVHFYRKASERTTAKEEIEARRTTTTTNAILLPLYTCVHALYTCMEKSSVRAMDVLSL